jgi:hypothetical protein
LEGGPSWWQMWKTNGGTRHGVGSLPRRIHQLAGEDGSRPRVKVAGRPRCWHATKGCRIDQLVINLGMQSEWASPRITFGPGNGCTHDSDPVEAGGSVREEVDGAG